MLKIKRIYEKPEEIIFTSCGSEANNLAIKGIASAYAKKGKHIIASPIEHHSVIHPLKNLVCSPLCSNILQGFP